jgi:hypothetical protein
MGCGAVGAGRLTMPELRPLPLSKSPRAHARRGVASDGAQYSLVMVKATFASADKWTEIDALAVRKAQNSFRIASTSNTAVFSQLGTSTHRCSALVRMRSSAPAPCASTGYTVLECGRADA